MGEKPDWIPQDDWENFIARPAREAERRRAEAALIRIAEHLDQQSTPMDSRTGDPVIDAVTDAKWRAIEAQDFETAARLRDEEKRLKGK